MPKPSIRTPLTSLVLAEIAADIFPPGVLNVITGSGDAIGDELVSHPGVAMVSVTGDTATGKRIARNAADSVKRLHLELGGKAPVLVFDDADVELAAETIRSAGYWNSGQDCTAACRVIAGPAVYERFVSALSDQVRAIRWGDPAAEGTWNKNAKEKEAGFAPVEGRFVRLVADSEINEGAWTSAAEIRILAE